MSRPVVLAAAALAVALLVPASTTAKSERDKTKSKLRRGEVIVKTSAMKGSKYPKVLAMGLIDVPPSKLWDVIGDCNKYKGNLPNIVEAKLLKRSKGKERCKVVVSIPLLPNLTAVTDAVETVVPDQKYVREWKLVKGDYKANVGKWTLMPFEGPNKTLAVYETHVAPKMEVPPNIQRMAIRNSLPGMYKLLRRKMAEKKD